MTAQKLTISNTDYIELEIPQFQLGLTSSVLQENLKQADLSVSDITNGRFIKNKLSPQVGFSTNQQNALADAVALWPPRLDWADYVKYLNEIIDKVLLCYAEGMPLRVILSLIDNIQLKTHLFESYSSKYRVFIHDLIATSINNYENYRFKYIQNHDAFSGLPNLYLLEQHLQYLFSSTGKRLGIVLIRFNTSVSNKQGYTQINADIIKDIPVILSKALTAGYLLFQTGRREYVITISDLADEISLELIATKISRLIDVELHHERKIYAVHAVIGGHSSLDDYQHMANFYENARIATIEASRLNKSVQIFNDSIKQQTQLMNELEQDVISGFEANHFELFLQPIVNIQLNKCLNAEALLRWKRADGSYMAPPMIIEVIYNQGLGQAFVRWLISYTCRISNEIETQLGYPLKIGINLTVNDLLDRDLPYLIMQQLAIWSVNAENLVLEITETGLLVDEARADEVIQELIKIGCPIAIDDFGTGYSSMSRLRNMPINSVKIDQSFVKNVAISATDQAIVSTIANLAHGLGKETVAEGGEDEACLAKINSYGCTKVQGYHFSKPLPYLACADWVKHFNQNTTSTANTNG